MRCHQNEHFFFSHLFSQMFTHDGFCPGYSLPYQAPIKALVLKPSLQGALAIGTKTNAVCVKRGRAPNQ